MDQLLADQKLRLEKLGGVGMLVAVVDHKLEVPEGLQLGRDLGGLRHPLVLVAETAEVEVGQQGRSAHLGLKLLGHVPALGPQEVQELLERVDTELHQGVDLGGQLRAGALSLFFSIMYKFGPLL